MLKDSIYRYLKYTSKEKPMSRHAYAVIARTDERAVRRAIHDLRNEGIRICSDSHGRGYWIAKDEAEYEAFRAEYVSRARDIMKTAKAMDIAGEKQMTFLGSLKSIFKR